MISKNSNEPQAAQPSGAQAGTAVPAMDPGSIIETASTGDGTINDPSGHDNKPPGNGDSDPLVHLLG